MASPQTSPEDELQPAATGIEYKIPAKKTLVDIVNADQEDESLRKYKESLLGTSGAGGLKIIIDDANPSNVIVVSLALVVEGRPDVVLQLRNVDPKQIKQKKFILKEHTSYRIRIDFYIQREIVSGLKYVQKVGKSGLLSSIPGASEKLTHMVGSYAPKADVYSFLTPEEEAPGGVMSRGVYNCKSLFTDDDAHEYLKWEWQLEIAKDWC